MINKVILQGRLTNAPDVKYTPAGVAVAKFTLAVQRDYVKQGEERQTDFINCTAFRKTAEFIYKFFGKGQMAVISGQLQTRSWDDKDGNKKFATDVIVDEIHFAEGKKDQTEEVTGASFPDEEEQYLKTEREGIQNEDGFIDINDADLPF